MGSYPTTTGAATRERLQESEQSIQVFSQILVEPRTRLLVVVASNTDVRRCGGSEEQLHFAGLFSRRTSSHDRPDSGSSWRSAIARSSIRRSCSVGTYTGSPKCVRRASWMTSERVRCSIFRARSTISNSSSGSVTATLRGHRRYSLRSWLALTGCERAVASREATRTCACGTAGRSQCRCRRRRAACGRPR